ncbi:MAG: diaminopimelate decarboxylase [bacterium]|nr:diaminopimelate decarboxylase [bacterium]
MHYFRYKKGKLHCEATSLETIARRVGTPCYIYSHQTLVRHWTVFEKAFASVPHRTCFAVKANSNLAVLRIFAKRGGGADIVSGGELFRARRAGIPAKRIVYSGVGKTAGEMKQALKEGILLFNVESEEELIALNAVAKNLKKKAPVSIRVNPEIDPKTHPYISTGLKKSKFGVPFEDSFALYKKARSLPFVEIQGVSYHIGSQITQISPFVDALKKVKGLVSRLRKEGFTIRYLDLGGGLGIPYENETPPPPKVYGQALKKELGGLGCTILFEPGRVIVGNAGILLTKVLYRKETERTGGKKFVIIDAAMNDLIRPALYQSYHEVWPVLKNGKKREKVDLVGPVCESGDFLAKGRFLPKALPGDLLAVLSAGAYGFTMASNYNSRPKIPEILVKGKRWVVIRERETYKDLIKGEKIPKFL